MRSPQDRLDARNGDQWRGVSSDRGRALNALRSFRRIGLATGRSDAEVAKSQTSDRLTRNGLPNRNWATQNETEQRKKRPTNRQHRSNPVTTAIFPGSERPL